MRSRLGGNIITAPGPPQCTIEDVVMSSISNFFTTAVERFVPNVFSTPPFASPLFEVQFSAQGPTSSNPPQIASPHHASGDIAMHAVASIDNAEVGTSSNINPVPLPVALPPVVQPEDRESTSTPATTSAGVDPSFWDDIYEPTNLDDDQTLMEDI